MTAPHGIASPDDLVLITGATGLGRQAPLVGILREAVCQRGARVLSYGEPLEFRAAAVAVPAKRAEQ